MELKFTSKKLLLAALLATLVAEISCKSELSGNCQHVDDDKCPRGYVEIYKEDKKEQSSDYYSDSGEEGVSRYCCTQHSGKAVEARKAAVGCRVTSCMDPKSWTKPNDICANIPSRYVHGKQLQYEEAIRSEDCRYSHKRNGVYALCCPKNHKEGLLTLVLGAEMHQFPHFAMIHIKKGPGKVAICGGTIYNERYIITASHCMLKDGEMHEAEGSKVFLDVRIANRNNPQTYDVQEFIPHPNSTLWEAGAPATLNDVALIKLKKKIKFGPHVKALPIAKTGFDPFKYSDETVIVGVGTTDTTLVASMLQRARTYLREDSKNSGGNHRYSKEEAKQVLFLGGIQDGKHGTRTGQGDSGGPAICRDENGLAVLCGLDSNGPDLARCEKKLDEISCRPGAFMEVQYFYDWFVSVAGNQSKAEVLQQPLYGAPVEKGKYLHQVRITSDAGPSCGGTLIEKDVVITAAHCVADDNGNKKGGLQVSTGVRDLNLKSDQGKKIDVKSVKVLDGFKLGTGGARSRRIAMLNVKPTPLYPYYKNDLAIVKLASEADIQPKKLPKIGPAPEDNGDTGEIIWTTEVSFPTNTKKSGKLQERKFQILELDACQRRMNRASYVNATIKVDDNIMCGEEMYNGAAQCDRELGGGLICEGDDGSDVLCGVQVFRFCQLALPSAFLDINQHVDWIKKNKS